ncbi:MAG: histidinol dehydrogenase [Bacteroidales bacterium]|nr:histidinol dehydrogenase [Bacteroidales bacterium]
MKIYQYPDRAEWPSLMRRPVSDRTALYGTVSAILDQVRRCGDEAVREYTRRFDGAEPALLQVSAAEIQAAAAQVPDSLKKAVVRAKQNIEAFHSAQRRELPRVETMPGVVCWQKALPIEKVGLYIPGGTAPLFSTVLMLAVPARLAGCREIVLCSPADRRTGQIHPAVLYAAQVCGIDKIFCIGGVQAIAAMAYGTESVPRVYKIFGPGNQYVMAAKQLVSMEDTAIDMPAGPSEVEVLADETASVPFVAADLLSQAEHGPDSQVLLVTDSPKLAQAVMDETRSQCEALPRHEIAAKALENSRIIVLKNRQDMMDFTNEYAPEHLIISTRDYADLAAQVRNAGSVFLGNYAPESAGDYASGTTPPRPTKGYAKAYSGVSLDSFLKKTTFQEISAEGLRGIGGIIEEMAANEQLFAHKNAVTLRLASLTDNTDNGK